MNDPLDLHTPLPDRAHEAIRLAAVQALADLQAQVQRIDDAYLLLLATAGFAQGTLNTTVSGQQAIAALQRRLDAARIRDDANEIRDETAADTIDDLQAKVAALAERVTALEDGSAAG